MFINYSCSFIGIIQINKSTQRFSLSVSMINGFSLSNKAISFSKYSCVICREHQILVINLQANLSFTYIHFSPKSCVYQKSVVFITSKIMPVFLDIIIIRLIMYYKSLWIWLSKRVCMCVYVNLMPWDIWWKQVIKNAIGLDTGEEIITNRKLWRYKRSTALKSNHYFGQFISNNIKRAYYIA